jgi:hypothetical protein
MASIIATASAVISALKAGSTINDPHPQLHLEERNAIAALQQAVSDNQAALGTLAPKVPAYFATEAAALAAGQAGTLTIGQEVVIG